MIFNNLSFSQQYEGAVFDCYSDTLAVIGNQTICQYKVAIHRHVILDADSIDVNIPGFKVCSYEMSSFSLGNNFLIESNSNRILPAMRENIMKPEYGYKFIYIKNILVIDEDGKKISPSLPEVRISFLD